MKQAGAILLVLALRVAGAQSFSAIPPVPTDSLRFERDLPAVEIKDAAGKVWRPEDFRGKYTLVYVFHTSEARMADARTGPGQDRLKRWIGLPDLREVQRFYDVAKDKRQLQVLAFCSDYDYTHAPEYMKQAGFDFPVVADWKLIDQVLGLDVHASRYAVIGPDGKLSAPFRSWSLGRVMFELEAIAGKS
jgi:peroxiredoxin